MATLEDRPYVWLSLVEGLGPRRVVQLLTEFDTPQALWEADAASWARVIGPAIAARMREAKPRVDDTIAWLEGQNIRIITRRNTEYPPYLQEVYDPPMALYAKGPLSLDRERMIAIVGSRRCTRYGQDMAHKLGAELAQQGITVVSGLARGIDTASHVGALSKGGETIGVLGCGIDVVYPPENGKLFVQMAEQGALVTEYLPGTPPTGSHFPLRNRIISGMSQGVVLVEATKGSGAMITVDYALDHGREIFAVPGNVTSSQSAETNRLIYEGRCMARDVGDILFGMGWERMETQAPTQAKTAQLSMEESLILQAVADQERSFEELVNSTGFDVSRLNSLLTTLVMRGIMKQSPGRVFSLRRDF